LSKKRLLEETMKRLMIPAAAFSLALGSAFAQTADKQGPNVNAPTKNMDAVTPEMKGPGKGEHPPTEAMDKATPTMKGDSSAPAASANAGSTSMDTWNSSYDSTRAQEEQLKAGGTKK
jgi:hypothetical protein